MLKLSATGLFAAAICAAAWAEPLLPPVYVERYAGTYSTQCDDAEAERLSIFEDRLAYADADVELVVRGIMTHASYWGRSPPEGFEVALVAGLNARAGLVFLMHLDEQGYYILLEYHPFDDEKADADPDDETRYYKCET